MHHIKHCIDQQCIWFKSVPRSSLLKYSVHNSVLRIFAFKVQLATHEGKANIISFIPIELPSKQRNFIFYKQASNKQLYKTIIFCNDLSKENKAIRIQQEMRYSIFQFQALIIAFLFSDSKYWLTRHNNGCKFLSIIVSKLSYGMKM